MNNNCVFIVDTNKKPLKPTTPKRARELLNKGKAAIYRRYPFTLILNDHRENTSNNLELRIDPGAIVTGLALVNSKNECIWGMELEHRGRQISSAMNKRQGFRRSRRSRQTRYRKKRFNRSKPSGWLAPSLMHRVQTTQTWIERICRYAPVSSIVIEKVNTVVGYASSPEASPTVKFDTQKLDNFDIRGIEYQQGTLAGYTIREALLEHWGRRCAYCGIENVPLQIDHIKPKSRNGSNRFSNLTLACQCCNQAKGNSYVEEFLANKPELLKKIKAHTKKPLADVAAVNSTRNKIFEIAKKSGLIVKAGSGALAKLVRGKSHLPKAHFIDAACQQIDQQPVKLKTRQPLLVQSKGHGNRQAVRCNASGFPAITITYNADGTKTVKRVKPKQKYTHSKAGDIVCLTLEKDRKHLKKGTYVARVKTPAKTGLEVKINGHRISTKLYAFIHRNDGYDYSFGEVMSI